MFSTIKIMTNLPKTLFVRTDVEDPEYQEAVGAILFGEGPGDQPVPRNTYYFRSDNGERIRRLSSRASALNVEDPWKVFNLESRRCKQFRDSCGERYESLVIDYDLLPERVEK